MEINIKFAVQLRPNDGEDRPWAVETSVSSKENAVNLLSKMPFIYGELFDRYEFRAVEISETIRVIGE